MSMGANIKCLREKKGLSQLELGKLVGVSDKAVSTWENNIKIPRMGTIQKIADFFGVTKSDIIETEESNLYKYPNIEPLPSTKKIPLLGSIACGTPILAEENIEEYINIPATICADFALRCFGDSMINARILDGDLVYIRKQPSVETGEIAAILIDGEATLKRVYRYPNKVVLQAENPCFEPLVFEKEELNEIEIIGKAVAFLSSVK